MRVLKTAKRVRVRCGVTMTVSPPLGAPRPARIRKLPAFSCAFFGPLALLAWLCRAAWCRRGSPAWQLQRGLTAQEDFLQGAGRGGRGVYRVGRARRATRIGPGARGVQRGAVSARPPPSVGRLALPCLDGPGPAHCCTLRWTAAALARPSRPSRPSLRLLLPWPRGPAGGWVLPRCAAAWRGHVGAGAGRSGAPIARPR